jgi:TadE-like protein
MALELALLTPLLVAFMMVMVGLGRVVEAQSQVDGAASDAARAASLGRTRSGANEAATSAAEETLSGHKWCRRQPNTSVDFSEWGRGGQVSVAVRCEIDLAGLSLIGFSPSKTMTGTATAPIDTLRRVE